MTWQPLLLMCTNNCEQFFLVNMMIYGRKLCAAIVISGRSNTSGAWHDLRRWGEKSNAPKWEPKVVLVFSNGGGIP